jgi:hypothetical protein
MLPEPFKITLRQVYCQLQLRVEPLRGFTHVWLELPNECGAGVGGEGGRYN